jgi:uncharacterized protein YjbI with pentapeptide repeats
MSKTTNSQWFTKLILSIGLIFLGICVVFILRPQYLVPDDKSILVKDRIELENKVRTTWIQAISGLGLFVAAYSAWLNYQTSQQKLEADKKNSEDQLTETRNKLEFDRENSEKQLAEIRKKLELDRQTSERNLELADSKQVTERFVKAVEQLGDKNSIIVRLGGIYSLGQISENSIEYYWIAMEVLTLFIREESNKRDEETERMTVKLSLERAEVAREEEWYHLKKIFNTTNLNSKKRRENLSYSDIVKLQDDQDAIESAKTSLSCYIIPQDIQATLTIIGQKNIKTKSDDKKLNLDDSNLNGANLNDLNLNKAYFQRAKLRNADLTNAKLNGSTFFLAKLHQTNFSKAKLKGANFNKAQLYGAKLNNAILENSNFNKAKLVLAELKNANLKGADLIEADLRYADLENADFNDSDIQKTQITVEQILKAQNWDKARYSPEFEKKLQQYLFFGLITNTIF